MRKNQHPIGEAVPGYEAVLWYGFWGPKHLPKRIVTLWNTEIRNTLKQPDLKARLANEGVEPSDSPPGALQRSCEARCRKMAEGGEDRQHQSGQLA